MSDDLNILVSNGTCYAKAGEKLDESFIPCGNVAFGHQTCCGAGDNCLADNSCYGLHGSGYGSQLTYMAGCTDPDYEDDSCPDKKGIDQPWIGLTRCDDNNDVWGACSQEGNPSTLQPGSFCSCTDAASFSPTAFSDAGTLTLLASLPSSTGDSISFESGHVPTGEPTGDSPAETGSPTGGSGSSGSGSGSGNNPTTGQSGQSGQATQTGTGGSSGSGLGSGTASQTQPTSSTSSGSGSSGDDGSSGNSPGLNSGAKIGIGVGIAVGVLLLIVLIIFFLLRRRRRHRSQAAAAAAEVEAGEKKDTPPSSTAAAADPRISDVTGTTNTATISEADGKPLSGAEKPGVTELDSEAVVEASGQTAHPWDMGSELDGRQVEPRKGEHLTPVAELPGTLANQSPPGWVVR